MTAMSEIALNIAVIEDLDPERKLICKILRREGHQVSDFASVEGLNSHKPTTIDLLITDIKLPGTDGLSFSRRFRESHPASRIIILTALDSTEDRAAGYEHGADIYLTKPISPPELIAAIKTLSRRLKEALQLAQSRETFTLNTRSMTLQGPQNVVSLSHSETTMLTQWNSAPEHLLGLGDLFRTLNLKENASSKSALEVRIVRLRKKISKTGYTLPSIKNIRGRGYQLSMALQIR